ncbi:gag/pol protein [Cucumis melo var. makuwa]|uniref:Gag/pol protein n=1 Tax=Cucumis melo var. makuwa TaxID=1194695 RepID=A0A5D3B6U9_CUCMM|nr:gag/pol protein [Cucumis melo var. makuwa]TYJ95572.1 gag/pol protein [Cucumis melo var. makuwa]
MSDVLAKKHESLATAKEIMDSLREMFGQPSWSLRHKAIKYIYTKQMKEGTSVREHVLDMMMHFNIAEVNGEFTLTTLLNELQRFHNLTVGKGKEVEANVATIEKKLMRGSSSKTRFGPSLMKKKKKGKTPKNSKGKKVAKGKCYHCNEDGHWLRNSSKYLAKKKVKNTRKLVLEKLVKGGIILKVLNKRGCLS